MSKDLSNQNYSLKGFENWLNAVEGRDKGLDSWDSFLRIWLKDMFEKHPKLTKQSKRFWEIMMKVAERSELKEYTEIFFEWLEKQKIEDEKELTREELKKELEKLIEIKEKELQKLKEQLKMIS